MSHLNFSMENSSEDERLARIAWFYYRDNLTQNEIGELLGIPRLKVSRLLEKARQQGIIKVDINSEYRPCFELEHQLKQLFNIQHISVIPDRTLQQEATTNTRLAIAASNLVCRLADENALLATGFGETIMQTLKYIATIQSSENFRFVSLAGGVAGYMQGIVHLEEGQNITLLPTPLRMSNKAVADALYQEPGIKEILVSAHSADIALVGVGAIQQGSQASMYQSGYISDGEQQLLRRKGAVGDILGCFFDSNGKMIDGIALHDEIIALSLEKLKHIPHVIGISGGEDKAEAICGALKGGYLDALVTNENTAREMLQYANDTQ